MSDSRTTVLVPIDGSPLSFDALHHALSTFPDAEIIVLHVVDLFEPGYGTDLETEGSYEPLMGTEEWYERADQVTDQLFEEVDAVAADYDRTVETTSEIGDPKRIIVDFTEEEAVDHVVLGAHGRSEKERSLFGSVTEIVARRVSVPVTLVR